MTGFADWLDHHALCVTVLIDLTSAPLLTEERRRRAEEERSTQPAMRDRAGGGLLLEQGRALGGRCMPAVLRGLAVILDSGDAEGLALFDRSLGDERVDDRL